MAGFAARALDFVTAFCAKPIELIGGFDALRGRRDALARRMAGFERVA
ncbi:hypothetical protein Q3C01_15770 [Bradyrhizobium sp. UFLA05-109]